MNCPRLAIGLRDSFTKTGDALRGGSSSAGSSQGSQSMPTLLPIRREPSTPVFFLVFLCALFVSAFVIEVVDPAPTDVEAAWLSSP